MSLAIDSDEEVQTKRFKVVVVGSGSVGKTSLVCRFCQDYFSESYKQTIGLDFFSTNITLPDGTMAIISLWDIGGQAIGSKSLRNYIFGADAILFVYDITNLQSFHDLKDWHEIVQDVFRESEQPIPLCSLLGNKTDLSHLRMIRISQHSSFAQEHTMNSLFVSAKTGDNVGKAFFKVAADLCGIQLTKTQLDSETQVMEAHIIQTPHNGEEVQVIEEASGWCSLQ
ncbi:hypothetical protein PCE1_001808 [Barthelona sp. PCE]